MADNSDISTEKGKIYIIFKVILKLNYVALLNYAHVK